MTSIKDQINHNASKLNVQNSLEHLKIDYWSLFVICFIVIWSF